MASRTTESESKDSARTHRDPAAALLVATVLLILAVSPLCAAYGRPGLQVPREASGESPAVAASTEPSPPTVDPRGVGAGELLCLLDGAYTPLPRGSTDVDITVAGIMVHATVAQTFTNPHPDVIEVLYVFPLPPRAAVHRMQMRIGARRIAARIQEREEAKQTYERAKRAGRKAALLDQERPNLFTIAAANIGPGESVAVVLEYVEELTYDDGEYSLRFPLTFTPRFIPTAPPDQVDAHRGGRPVGAVPVGVPDAARITPPFIPTHDDRGMRASIRARVDPGFALERIECPSHDVRITSTDQVWDVQPSAGSVRADRDFLLRWRLAPGQQPQAALFLESHPRHPERRFGLLMVVPPEAASTTGRGMPTETLFVIDVSGSMQGPSIEQAREALLAALGRLRAGDRFNMLRFNDTSDVFGLAFVSAGDRALMERARAWVRALDAGGGTRILPALQRAVAMIAGGSPARQRRIILLTDAAVGNEQVVLQELHRGLGGARLHVIGIGRAPNSYLTREMAAAGRGLCSFIGDLSEAENRIDAFLARIDRPVLTNLELALQAGSRELALEDQAPQPLPDLHAGEPLMVSFRIANGIHESDPEHDLTVTLRGETVEGPVALTAPARTPTDPRSGVALRWARARVGALMDDLNRPGRDASAMSEVRAAILDLALDFQLVTAYTSFVAVEELPSVDGLARTVRMPNTLPSGSHLLGLPRGGTTAPLWRWAAAACAALGLLVMTIGALRRGGEVADDAAGCHHRSA